MSYIYSFFSIAFLIPLYFSVKKLTSSFYPVTVFFGLSIAFLSVLFHMMVLNAHEIPILRIPVPVDNEFMHYGPLIYAILCAVVSMFARE